MIRSRRLAAAWVACVALLSSSSSPALAAEDALFAQQWNLAEIGAPDGWRASTGAGVTIGVVDSGIDASHPDLAGKVDAMAICLGGPCREGAAADGDGHGTSVAGIAAAHTRNGDGIAGVAPDARLVVAKAIADDGSGSADDINNAIRWVVDHGARVVNLSLGDPRFRIASRLGTPLRPAIEYAWSRGAIPVIAAGNYNVGLLDEGGANYGNLDAVVVGATGPGGAVAWYSSPLGNAKWALVAPGGDTEGDGTDILSTAPGGLYDWYAGTSMAGPHVSGTLALLLAQGLSPTEAVQRLLDTADRSSPCGPGCQGHLRVAAAVTTPAGGDEATDRSPAGREDKENGVSPLLATLGMTTGAAAAGTAVWWLRTRRKRA